MHTHIIHGSYIGSGCVSPCKDHRTNATGSWGFSHRRQHRIWDNQSPPNWDKHRQKPGGCVFPGWADVLILSCLPSTLSSHSSLTHSFHGSLPWPHSPALDLLKRRKKKEKKSLQTDRDAVKPELTPFCPSSSISLMRHSLYERDNHLSQRILPYWLEYKKAYFSIKWNRYYHYQDTWLWYQF